MEHDTIPKQIESVITSKELISLSEEYGEIAIDGFLDDGVLKDIPILGTAISLVTFGNSVNKKLFIKKIYKFLFQLRDIPVEKRTEIIDRLNRSEKYQSKVGETIFEILEKIESEGKPEIIGRLFAATLDERISYIDFLRLTHIIKNQFYYDLLDLKSHVRGDAVLGLNLTDSLFTSGLVSTDFLPMLGAESEKREPNKGLTEYGKMLILIGMAE